MNEAHELAEVIELSPAPAPVDVFRALATEQRPIFFDSAIGHPTLGRYSFIAADPFGWITHPVGAADPLCEVQRYVQRFAALTIPGLPPWQGGAAGLLSYDLGASYERVPATQYNEFPLPAIAVGLYDAMIAFDHQQNRAWIISHGWPKEDSVERRQRAIERAEWLKWRITQPPRPLSGPPPQQPLVAPTYSTPHGEQVCSNFSEALYLSAVTRAIEYIHAGDVFQVNLAQRLIAPQQQHAAETYLRLRRQNPAPFAAYLDLGDVQVASASPERFLSVRNGEVETRPIKGTRPRGRDELKDRRLGAELTANEKDRAENIMIVDLLRNDLSRTCTPTSVRVSTLCGLERYAHVQHLVSVIEGRLRTGLDACDLLRGAFPGGSITGAPKVRAMEIIAELEPTARGAYCGSLAYWGFDGAFDSSILIRPLPATAGWWQAPVGGGIVADSVPQNEYEETWHKARGLVEVLI